MFSRKCFAESFEIAVVFQTISVDGANKVDVEPLSLNLNEFKWIPLYRLM